jgi:parvulin-like peptidyl-prolyl isomerase
MLLVPAIGCSKSDVVATVNGDKITRSAFERQVELAKMQSPQAFETEESAAEYRPVVLEGMIDAMLLRQEALAKDGDLSDTAVDARIEMYTASYPTPEEFEKALTDAGITMNDLRGSIRDQLAYEFVYTLASEEATPLTDFSAQDVAAYYEERKEDYVKPAESHLQHILFDADDKATAEKVLAEVRAGGDIEALAKKHSKDDSVAQNSGDLGWSPTSTYVPEFKAAADKLAVGAVSDLVQTKLGWHIIKKVEERPEVATPLSEAEPFVRQALAQAAMDTAADDYIARLRSAATIEFLDEDLKPEGF